MSRRRTSYPIRCLQMVGTALAVGLAGCFVESVGLCLRWLAGAR